MGFRQRLHRRAAQGFWGPSVPRVCARDAAETEAPGQQKPQGSGGSERPLAQEQGAHSEDDTCGEKLISHAGRR